MVWVAMVRRGIEKDSVVDVACVPTLSQTHLVSKIHVFLPRKEKAGSLRQAG